MSEQRLQLGGPISAIPSCAAADMRLKPTDVLVLNILGQVQSTSVDARRSGWFLISQGILAALTPYERAAINKSIKRLTSADYLLQHHQKNAFGGDAPCLYQINYNVVLPAQYDRWNDLQHLLDQLQTDEEKVGVPQRVTPVPQGTPPVSLETNPAKTAEKVGVPQGTPPVSLDTPPESLGIQGGQKPAEKVGVPQGTGGVLSESDSSDFFKRIGESESDAQARELIIEMFIVCRKKAWGTSTNPYPRHILSEQVDAYLAQGLSAEKFAKITFDNMQNACERGYAAPSGFKMFRKNFQKALNEQGQSLLSSPRKPVETALPAVSQDHARAWFEVIADVQRRDEQVRVYADSIALFEVSRQELRAIAKSRFTADIMRHSPALQLALKEKFGVDQVVWADAPELVDVSNNQLRAQAQQAA